MKPFYSVICTGLVIGLYGLAAGVVFTPVEIAFAVSIFVLAVALAVSIFVLAVALIGLTRAIYELFRDW